MHDRSEILVVEDSAQSAIVRVRGELDFLTADELEAAMKRAQHGSGRIVVVDFTECRYIDSSVLSVLIRAGKNLGSGLRIVAALNSHVRRIFMITNLDRTIRIEENLGNALS